MEFGKYAGDKKITEQELIRVYIGYWGDYQVIVSFQI